MTLKAVPGLFLFFNFRSVLIYVRRKKIKVFLLRSCMDRRACKLAEREGRCEGP